MASWFGNACSIQDAIYSLDLLFRKAASSLCQTYPVKDVVVARKGVIALCIEGIPQGDKYVDSGAGAHLETGLGRLGRGSTRFECAFECLDFSNAGLDIQERRTGCLYRTASAKFKSLQGAIVLGCSLFGLGINA
jgi:hypothetical protein